MTKRPEKQTKLCENTFMSAKKSFRLVECSVVNFAGKTSEKERQIYAQCPKAMVKN